MNSFLSFRLISLSVVLVTTGASFPLLDPCLQTCNEVEVQQAKLAIPKCDQQNVPRFLFAGQSNMEGWSEHALPGSFRRIIRILHRKSPKKAELKLIEHLNNAKAAKDHTSRNEAKILVKMRALLTRKDMFRDHPTTMCSFTMPKSMKDLDCERPLSSTACGGNHQQYGPEFVFGHVFPKEKSPFRGQKISITKVAVGGTTISQWMKENRDEDDNYWYALVDAIKGSNGSMEAFVWFQGENEIFTANQGSDYLDNLRTFIADVRQEIFERSIKFESASDIPVIIVEMGYWIDNFGGGERGRDVINAQNAFVEEDPYAELVKSGAGGVEENLSEFYHYDAASILIVGKRIAKTLAALLREISAQHLKDAM